MEARAGEFHQPARSRGIADRLRGQSLLPLRSGQRFLADAVQRSRRLGRQDGEDGLGGATKSVPRLLLDAVYLK